MDGIDSKAESRGDASWAALQSLICLLREKRVIDRQDIADLVSDLEARAAGARAASLPCCAESLQVAAEGMAQINAHTKQRYGGNLRPRH